MTSGPRPLPGCSSLPCPKCGEDSPCVDHTEVDVGIGPPMTGEHQYACPRHGLWGFTSAGDVVFQDGETSA